MKQFFKYLIIFLLFTYSPIYCQSFGISAGYGSLNMNEVNQDLDDFGDVFSSIGAFTSLPEEVTGGLYLEGNFKYPIGIFNLGISGNYISSSGNFNYSATDGSFEANYDASTVEVLGLFEIFIPLENSSFHPFVQLAGGVGFASAERLWDFRILNEQTVNLTAKNAVDGNYFAGRIKGGVQFVLQNIILEAAAGYRIANAGELIGDLIVNSSIGNNETVKNAPVEDMNGNAIEFDYSGFMLTAGISIVIL